MNKRLLIAVVIIAILGAGLVTWFVAKPTQTKQVASTSNAAAPQNETKTSSPETPKPVQPVYDLKTPSSVTVIVNKQNPLPDGYAPDDLVVANVPLRTSASQQDMQIRKVAAADLERLFTDAAAAGLQLTFGSGYRSQAYQASLYSSYVRQDGQAAADTYSARPRYSEHQSGLALDFTRRDGSCYVIECFGTTAEGKWLAANAQNYGFVLRYPEGKQGITGYQYEPWHFRYVGIDTAKQVYASGKTLEEFFSLPPAPSY